LLGTISEAGFGRSNVEFEINPVKYLAMCTQGLQFQQKLIVTICEVHCQMPLQKSVAALQDFSIFL